MTEQAAPAPDVPDGHPVPMAQTLEAGQVVDVHGHVEQVEVDGVQPKLSGKLDNRFHRDQVGVTAVALPYRRVDEASELNHSP